MTKKLFISYSHKDEAFKDSLEEHLSALKRNQIIETWHDRKITSGQNWSEEISTNLDDSEIVLFLVSPSFLSSDYCVGIEAKRAIELHNKGAIQVIPVVIRPCDWGSSDFAKFQAVPKDAKPISSWANQDEAWLDAVNGIKNHLSKFQRQSTKIVSTNQKLNLPIPSENILNWIDDTEVILTHRKVNAVKLHDIYVSLDLEAERSTNIDDIEVKNSDLLFTSPGKYLISGEEQQGKTTLLKHAYQEFLKQEFVPIYLDATKIKQSDLNKILEVAISEQYINLSLESYLLEPKKVLLIDNLSDIGLNSKYRGNFLSTVNDIFENVIFTSSSSIAYVVSEITQLDSYDQFELLGLGHKKRAEIVEKWISLGVEESITESDLYSECDEIKLRLDTIIRKNIVPPKPIYILMLLQMFEAYSQQNLDLSSHGHCYQQLIYQAFDHAKIPKNEVNKYLNVLTELSWVFHKNGGAINQFNLETFFTEYAKTYLAVDGAKIVEKLKSNSILTETDSKIQFKYPYLYYFFAGKKIAESYLTSDETQIEVRKLITNLHREDYANILVFVTHHTKEPWVLQEIQGALNTLFSDQIETTLSRDQLGFMSEFIAQIPNLVMEQREIREERKKHNQKLDDIDRNNDEDFNANDLLANINKTFKGMEISGQIIRNRHATLVKTTIFDLARDGAFSGLRFLKFFIDISDSAKSEVTRYIELKLREHPDLSNTKIQENAEDIFLHMTYGVINNVIKKIASSIGSQEAQEIYDQIEKENPTPAITLLNQAIEMHFKRKLDIQSISNSIKKLENNPVCTRILKEMVIQHTYMFPVDYKEKQQLAYLLKIPVQNQRLMDRKKIGKG